MGLREKVGILVIILVHIQNLKCMPQNLKNEIFKKYIGKTTPLPNEQDSSSRTPSLNEKLISKHEMKQLRNNMIRSLRTDKTNPVMENFGFPETEFPLQSSDMWLKKDLQTPKSPKEYEDFLKKHTVETYSSKKGSKGYFPDVDYPLDVEDIWFPNNKGTGVTISPKLTPRKIKGKQINTKKPLKSDIQKIEDKTKSVETEKKTNTPKRSSKSRKSDLKHRRSKTRNRHSNKTKEKSNKKDTKPGNRSNSTSSLDSITPFEPAIIYSTSDDIQTQSPKRSTGENEYASEPISDTSTPQTNTSSIESNNTSELTSRTITETKTSREDNTCPLENNTCAADEFNSTRASIQKYENNTDNYTSIDKATTSNNIPATSNTLSCNSFESCATPKLLTTDDDFVDQLMTTPMPSYDKLQSTSTTNFVSSTLQNNRKENTMAQDFSSSRKDDLTTATLPSHMPSETHPTTQSLNKNILSPDADNKMKDEEDKSEQKTSVYSDNEETNTTPIPKESLYLENTTSTSRPYTTDTPSIPKDTRKETSGEVTTTTTPPVNMKYEYISTQCPNKANTTQRRVMKIFTSKNTIPIEYGEKVYNLNASKEGVYDMGDFIIQVVNDNQSVDTLIVTTNTPVSATTSNPIKLNSSSPGKGTYSADKIPMTSPMPSYERFNEKSNSLPNNKKRIYDLAELSNPHLRVYNLTGAKDGIYKVGNNLLQVKRNDNSIDVLPVKKQYRQNQTPSRKYLNSMNGDTADKSLLSECVSKLSSMFTNGKSRLIKIKNNPDEGIPMEQFANTNRITNSPEKLHNMENLDEFRDKQPITEVKQVTDSPEDLRLPLTKFTQPPENLATTYVVFTTLEPIATITPKELQTLITREPTLNPTVTPSMVTSSCSDNSTSEQHTTTLSLGSSENIPATTTESLSQNYPAVNNVSNVISSTTISADEEDSKQDKETRETTLATESPATTTRGITTVSSEQDPKSKINYKTDKNGESSPIITNNMPSSSTSTTPCGSTTIASDDNEDIPTDGNYKDLAQVTPSSFITIVDDITDDMTDTTESYIIIEELEGTDDYTDTFITVMEEQATTDASLDYNSPSQQSGKKNILLKILRLPQDETQTEYIVNEYNMLDSDDITFKIDDLLIQILRNTNYSA